MAPVSQSTLQQGRLPLVNTPPKTRDTSHLKQRNKEFNRHKEFTCEAAGGLTCTGCSAKILKGENYFDGLDDLGSGKFCTKCWDNIEQNRFKLFVNEEWYTPEQKRRIVDNKFAIGMATYTTGTAKKPITTGTKWTQGSSYQPKCRHYEGLPMGDKGGVLWVSSSFHDEARLNPDADAALFFASSWSSKIAPPFAVWRKGDGKIALPDAEPEISGPVLFIDWKDHGAPPPGIVKWVDWAANLMAEGKTLQIGCMGGHGRTGTFIALVALKMGLVNNALQAHYFTWKNVCYNTIESIAQEKTIYAFAGEIDHYVSTDVTDFKKACRLSDKEAPTEEKGPAPKVITPRKGKKKSGART